MIELSIPGRGELRIEHLVTDVNGTLTVDGQLISGLNKHIASLRDRVTVHLLTSDLVVPDIFSALDLLEKPLCIAASLRK
jgi:hypothetical protein